MISLHRVAPDPTSVHPDHPINLQIGPITAARSFHQRSNGSQASATPVYRACVLTVALPRASLFSRRRLPLSLPISHLRPSKASKPPQKGRYPHKKQNPGRFQRFLRPIRPEKGRDRHFRNFWRNSRVFQYFTYTVTLRQFFGFLLVFLIFFYI